MRDSRYQKTRLLNRCSATFLDSSIPGSRLQAISSTWDVEGLIKGRDPTMCWPCHCAQPRFLGHLRSSLPCILCVLPSSAYHLVICATCAQPGVLRYPCCVFYVYSYTMHFLLYFLSDVKLFVIHFIS